MRCEASAFRDFQGFGPDEMSRRAPHRPSGQGEARWLMRVVGGPVTCDWPRASHGYSVRRHTSSPSGVGKTLNPTRGQLSPRIAVLGESVGAHRHAKGGLPMKPALVSI